LYCQKRKFGTPCIKVWGPVKQRTSILGPPATPTDQVIEPENVMLLQYLYHYTFADNYIATQFSYMAKEAARIFSPSINSLSLRYALLLFAGVLRGNLNMSPLCMRNASLARLSLLKKPCATMDQADLLAALVLAMVSMTQAVYIDEDRDLSAHYYKEFRVHTNGVESILFHIFKEDDTESRSSGLATIWSPIREIMLSILFTQCPPPVYFRACFLLRQIVGPLKWPSSVPFLLESGKALQQPLSILLSVIESIAGKALQAKLKPYADGADQRLETVVRDAKDTLESISNNIGKAQAITNRHSTKLSMRMHTCRILFALLDSSNVITALQGPVVVDAVPSLFQSSCIWLRSVRNLHEAYLQGQWPSLYLLMLVIPTSVDLTSLKLGNCKIPSLGPANVRRLRCGYNVIREWACCVPGS